MAKTKSDSLIPASYINSLKDKAPIDRFYTKITGIQFQNINSRLRAKTQWRRDEHPSLCFFPRNNTLTDFGDQSNYVNKIGKVYNHIDLLLITKVCKSYYDAVLFLANYVGETIPNNLLKNIQHYTKRQEALNDIYLVCRNTMNAMFFDNADAKQTFMLRAYCETRKLPFDQKFFDLLEIGMWPAKSIVETICKKYELDMDKNNKDEMSFTHFPEVENNAIVFPLYNRQGALVGIKLRTLEDEKRIFTSVLNDQALAMYGLNYALSDKNVAIAEGEMNRVAVAAALWGQTENEKDLAAKVVKQIFCTGSLANNAKLKVLEGTLNRVFYFPDVQLKDPDKKDNDRATVDNVIDVYNYLKPLEFKTIYWANQKDKYDLDDYLRENLDNRKQAYFDIFKTHNLRKNISEFLYCTIEKLVLNYADDARNSARFSFCERFSKRLFNNVDQLILKNLYSDLTGVDDDMVRQLDDAVFTQINDSDYYIKNNCYWKEETDKNGVVEKLQISDFIIRGQMKMTSLMKGHNKSKSEDLDVAWESTEIYAEISFHKMKAKRNVIFKVEDLVDYKKFWNNVYSAEISLINAVKKDREADVFFCIKNTLSVVKEKLSYPTPGPHMKSFATETMSNVLRPNFFVKDGTLKTYLSKYVSVIDGKVVENKILNIDLSRSVNYKFSTCNEETLMKISHTLWYKLRKLHDRTLVDGLIGFAFCTPIKHILDNNVNGLHLFLIGNSNSHKTSLARIIQNFYGDFATDDKVNAFNNQTPKHLEAAIAATGSCICVCDEFKPSKDYTVEAMNNMVHNLYNGKTRGRLNTKSEMVDINYFNANVITTAEYAQDLETSAEARYLRFYVPLINTEDIYREVNGSETLPLFKCFTPYLIAWQHNNIDTLIERYKFYYKAIEKTIKDEPNNGRIALQLSMILTGFYSFCKFLEHKEVCTKEEADKAIQELFISIQSQAKVQVARSTEVRVMEKFKTYFSEAIISNTFNVASMLYDQNDKPKQVVLSQQHNPQYFVLKYRKNPSDESSIVYAITSWRLLTLAIKRHFDFTLADSLKQEFADMGFALLDEKGNIQSTRIPDFQSIGSGKTKTSRAIIVPAKTLNMEGNTDDREPEGF
jgi:hypothetical protein